MAAVRQSVTEEISDAFMELMTEKPFTEITVTDVVKKAGVARASFYRNFSSTSDILDTVLNKHLQQFREYVLPVISSQDERRWRAFLFRHIYFVNDNHHRLIEGETSNISIILYRMANAVQELSRSLQFDTIQEKYSISARIGVINNVLLHWIDAGREETPEELVDYLMRFILDI